MGWRLHLSTQPVANVQSLPAEDPLVAVWDTKHTVHYYTQSDATPAGQHAFAEQIIPDTKSDDRQSFLDLLQAPNKVYLPTIYLNGQVIHQSRDGRLRLYRHQDGRLSIEVEDHLVKLNEAGDGRFIVAGLDRALGLCAAINEDGQLFVFQQHVRVGSYDLDLESGMDARLNLAMPDGLGRIMVSDGQRVLLLDSAGRVQHKFDAFYTVGPIAISANGKHIALGDMDDNLIRIYDSTLQQTHQKHAIDLIAKAKQVQLIASLPMPKAALTALTITNEGQIVFSLGGVICVTDLVGLDELPSARQITS